ncbi:zinc-binding oxidoreductase ToxD [Pseudohyphozyma bogoriensis]|nr:zinc-binding oxidoreductase ToxD [Pseudohyphozyma bogoriensis]
MSAPSSYKAIVVTDKGVATLKDVQAPPLAPNELRVKTKAVALNPTDWKHRDQISPLGSVLGCDFSGEVVELGPEVKGFTKGDRVAGMVHGGLFPDKGSFAEYLNVEHELVWKVPDGTDWEQAASMGGVAPHTVYQTLYATLGLATPLKPTSTPTPLLIWSGATGVGMAAIQMAKASGYFVITTTSEKNKVMIKSLGADAVYLYADPGTPAQIAADYPDLHYGLDTIGEHGSSKLISQSFASHKGEIANILRPAEGDNDGYDDIKVHYTLAYKLLGRAFRWDFGGGHGMDFPAEPESRAAFEQWIPQMTEIVAKGLLKPSPLWRQEGGLERLNDGLEILKHGKHSGQKVTYLV